MFKACNLKNGKDRDKNSAITNTLTEFQIVKNLMAWSTWCLELLFQVAVCFSVSLSWHPFSFIKQKVKEYLQKKLTP